MVALGKLALCYKRGIPVGFRRGVDRKCGGGWQGEACWQTHHIKELMSSAEVPGQSFI